MGVDEVVGRVRAVGSVDGSSDRETVLRGVADLAAIRRWCDGREVALAGYMKRHSPIPEKPMAKAAQSSQRAARKALQRGETAAETPALAGALERGDIGAGHVDAAAAVLRNSDDKVRGELAKRIDALASEAGLLTAEGSRAGCETSNADSKTTRASPGCSASSERSGSTTGSIRRRA